MRRALLAAALAGCGAPFTATGAELVDADPPSDHAAAPEVVSDVGNDVVREAAADVDAIAQESGADVVAEAGDDGDAASVDAPAPDVDAGCTPEGIDSYACGSNMLTVVTPAHVCLLSGSNYATEQAVPAACQCMGDFTCACLLASGAFCGAASCSNGSGHPIIRGCT